MKIKLLCLLAVVVVSILLIGCEGPEGPQGEPGTSAPEELIYNYLGNNLNECGAHCHGDISDKCADTKHFNSFASIASQPSNGLLYCAKCHTTGFDSEIQFGETEIAVFGPDITGFDDYYPPMCSEDSLRAEALQSVQCEACHGPMGPEIHLSTPNLSFTTRQIDGLESSLCAGCHEELNEWHNSGHGKALETHGMTIDEFNSEFNSFSSCWECHTGEGFASVNDTYWAARSRPETASLIGCPACHDPMSNENEHQLRSLDNVDVVYDAEYAATFSDKGAAQLCAQCHHATRNAAHVQNQIDNGYAHFGPHGSPQMDMIMGTGCYEISGYDYTNNRAHAHRAVDNSCVGCHMTVRSHTSPQGWVGGHDFIPDIESCQTCHSGITDFDLNGAASEIDTLLNMLITAIGVPVDSLGSATATTTEQRMAGYAYVFVTNDGSRGIHNPAYAKALLENALVFIDNYNNLHTN